MTKITRLELISKFEFLQILALHFFPTFFLFALLLFRKTNTQKNAKCSWDKIFENSLAHVKEIEINDMHIE